MPGESRTRLPPLVAAWAMVLAGHVLVAPRLPWSALGACRAAAAALGAAALFGSFARRGAPPGRVARVPPVLIPAVASLVLAGASLGLEASRDEAPLEVHPRGIDVEVEGFVADAAGSGETHPAWRFDVRRARVGRREASLRATIVVRWPAGSVPPEWAVAGAAVRARGAFRPPEDARNAGSSPPGRRLLAGGAAGILDAVPGGVEPWAATAVERGSDRGAWARLMAEARRTLARRFDAVASSPAAPLARGMLLGDRADVEPELRDSFRNAGTLHILSISGLHVCIVAIFLAAVARAIGLPAAAATAAELLGLAAYVVFVGAPAPALRSALLWAFTRGAKLLGRQASPLAGWGAAGLALHLAGPALVHDLGFALSFGAVLGLCAAGALAPRRLPDAEATRPRRIARSLGAAAVSGIGAAAGTLPIEAASFGSVPLAGPVANLVVIPLTTLFLAEAILTAVAGWLVPDPVERALGGALEASGALLVRANDLLGGRVVPLSLRGASPIAASAAALLALLTMAALASTRTSSWAAARRRAWGVALLAVVVLLPVAAARAAHRLHTRRDAPALIALDVGQGDALLVMGARGEAILVDAGPRSERRDEGRFVVEPLLRAERVGRLVAVSSHGHRDHEGGLLWLARRGWIGRALENGGGAAEREAWRDAVRRGGGRVEVPASGGARLDAGAWAVRVEPPRAGRDLALGPLRPGEGSANATENDRSLVAFASCRGSVEATALLPGDLERAGEEAWLASGCIGEVDVLKVPHHGSRTSSTAAWVDRVRPRLALISAGERNRHGHPSPSTVTRYRRAGAWVLRTDREGAIRVTKVPAGLLVSTRSHPGPRLLPARNEKGLSPYFDFP